LIEDHIAKVHGGYAVPPVDKRYPDAEGYPGEIDLSRGLSRSPCTATLTWTAENRIQPGG